MLYSRCSIPEHSWFDLKSPSGHTALSLAIYGTFAVIVSTSLKIKYKFLPLLIAGALVSLIAFSRVALGYHTSGDVWVGLGAGFIVNAAIYLMILRHHIVQCEWRPFLVIATISIIILYGVHAPAEQLINLLAQLFRVHVHGC